MRDRLNLMNAFELMLAIREHGNLTAAARSMGITQSAASRQLVTLESLIGTPLFKRTTRSIAATEAGKALTDGASDLVRMADVLIEQARMADRAPGTLRVSATPLFGQRHVVPHLLDFQREHPKIEVRLNLLEGNADLLSHDIDLAIEIGHERNGRVVVSRIAKQQRILCASPVYLKERGVPNSPEDLQNHPCLIHSRLAPSRIWHFWKDKLYRKVRVSGPLASNFSQPLIDAAIQGLGITLLASWAVHAEIESGQLVRVPLDWRADMDTQAREITFAWPPELSRAPRLRAFIDFLKRRYGRPPYWN